MFLIKTILCLTSLLVLCHSRQLTDDQPDPSKLDNDTKDADDNDDQDNTQSLADYNKAVGNVVSIGSAVEQLAIPGTSSGISTVNSVNMMQFVRYVNMSYPYKVEKLFKAQGLKTVGFSFGPLFPESLMPYAAEYQPVGEFSRYQTTTLFLINYWKTIITIPILLVGALIIVLLGKLEIKNSLYLKVCGFGKNFLLWNFFITFVLSNVDQLTMCSILEIRNLRLDSPIAIVSFCINISLVLSATILMIIFTRKAYLISKQDKKTDIKEKLVKYTTTKVLFEELKNTYLHQQLFFSISVIRIITNNIIIGTTHHPVLQTIFLLATNISFMLYLVFGRPYVSRLRNLELLCYEATTLAVNIACVRLSFMESEEQRNSMVDANAITRSTAAVSTLSIFFAILKNGLIIVNIVKAKLAERKKTEKKSSSKANELPDAKNKYLENENENEKERLTEEEKSLHLDIIQEQKEKVNNSFDLEKTGLEKTSLQLLNIPKRSVSLEQTYSYLSSSRSSPNAVESIRNKEL